MKKAMALSVIVFGLIITTAAQSKLTAKVDGDVISLSDGRTFKIRKTKAIGTSTEVEMKAPLGAAVILIQDDNKEIFRAEVPFTYAARESDLHDKYFKLDVTEGNNKWSVKLKNDNTNRIVIE